MKKIQKEVITKSYVDVFVANDGTEFSSQSECKKYDESAKGVLLAKYAPMVVKTFSEEDIFCVGSENYVEVASVKTQEDADILLQLYILEHPYINDEGHKEVREEIVSKLNSAIGDFMVVGRGYDRDDFYFYGSRKSIIEDFGKKFEQL